MKQRIIEAIDANKEAIIACGEYVLNNPELGFKEIKTSAYIKEQFEKLGIPFTDNLGVMGVMGAVGNPKAETNICIIGEMDAIKCYDHPNADKEFAYITASKMLACTVYDLAKDDGKLVKNIKDDFKHNKR